LLSVTESRTSEVALVRAAQNGDRTALGALYQQYGRLVHGVLLAYVSPCHAEDLMQDVFVKVMERLPALREPAAFPGWLIAITRRTAIDYGRGAKAMTELREYRARGGQPDGEAFAVLAVIKRLPESYRETLILRLVEGMTGPEIAVRTGLTPESVRVNLCRGAKLLRALLEGEGRL
jgi:RNA polymerase sigma-70 factor (ECF subfamily)